MSDQWYIPRGPWRDDEKHARAEGLKKGLPYWLKPATSPREEALAMIKAAEARARAALKGPFTKAQYARWSQDPRSRPATYYDGSPNPVGYATREAYEYVLALWQAQRVAEREARIAGEARVAARHEEYRARLARGAKSKPKGKRKAATA